MTLWPFAGLNLLRPDTFPFLKLPGEVKNMIYRIALAQGATHWCCKHPVGYIGIEDMFSDDFDTYRESHPRGSRTLYTPLTFPCWCCPEHQQAARRKTTYKLGSSLTLPCLGLMALDKQTRSEALPIFYGENTFSFRTTASVRPFLGDLPSAARQNIHSIELVLNLSDSSSEHRQRQRAWIRTFQYLQRHIDLRKLNIEVIDFSMNFMCVTRFVGWEKEWIRALAQIRDLDYFGLEWSFVGHEEWIDMMTDDWGWFDDDDIELEIDLLDDWMFETEANYEHYFRSRMLKKRQRSLDAWLERHVCDAHCKKVSKGRAAIRPGLPRSITRGSWTVPQVELDEFYDSSNLDDLSEDEYTDAEYSVDEDEDAEKGDNTDTESNDTFHTCDESPGRALSIEL